MTCLVKWRRGIPPGFFHTLSLLSVFPSLPSLLSALSEPRPSRALPGRRTQPHVRHLTPTHYPSLSSVSASPPPHPPHRLFRGKLPSFVVPEAASQQSSALLLLNHSKHRQQRSSRWIILLLTKAINHMLGPFGAERRSSFFRSDSCSRTDFICFPPRLASHD